MHTWFMMASLKSILQPEEEEVVALLFSLLSTGLKQMEDVWGEHPYLHHGRVLFEQRCSKSIPLIEIYCVLGGQYKNGNFYEAFPLAEQPGLYAYDHKVTRYRLLPVTWLKAAVKHLVETLRKVITEESDKIPSRVNKLMVKEGRRSLCMLCQFTDHKDPTLGVLFTPALEGCGWPEHFEGANQKSKNLPTTCFLLSPFEISNVVNGWELAFPNVSEGVLDPEENRAVHAVLLLTWLAEKRGWNKVGLRNPSAAFHSIALHLVSSHNTFATRCVRDQIRAILDDLQKSIMSGSLNDFCVPALNYLHGITEAEQEGLNTEVGGVVIELEQPEGLRELYHEYPLMLPETQTQDYGLRDTSPEDCDSEISANDHVLHGDVEQDERAAGEGCFIVGLPLDVKQVTDVDGGKANQEIEGELNFQQDSSTLLPRDGVAEMAGHQNARMMGTLLELILLAVFFIVAMREIGSLLGCARCSWTRGTISKNGDDSEESPETFDEFFS